MINEATLSSRKFSKLIWSRRPGAFDLNCDFTFIAKDLEVDCLFKVPMFFEGGPSKVHGGIIAALMDEAQGALCYHLGHFVMTDHLSIDYKKAIPVQQEIRIRARLSAVRKKKLYSKAYIYSSNKELMASSRARWYLFSPRILQRVQSGYYSENDWQKIMSMMHANRIRSKAVRASLKNKNK